MSLSGKMITLSNRLTKGFRAKYFSNLPTEEFQEKHLQHLVSLPNREKMLSLLPSNAIVAEIGVYQGAFAEKILTITHPRQLYLIDLWSEKHFPGVYDGVIKKFSSEIKSEKIKIIRALSYDGVQSVDDHFFDWVYLDTDHTYAVTKKELELIRPKIKPGGIIAGHDYLLGNWNGGVRYGVIEAVREFCLKYNWELIYLTHELKMSPSFAIREIG